MLSVPPAGFSRSTERHNVNLQILCDWIEGSLLFDGCVDSISYSDVIDLLIEEQIYNDQDFASEFIEIAWAEIRRRQSAVSQGSPFQIGTKRISRICSWEEVPEYSFCLLLSLGVWHNLQTDWQRKFGGGYSDQGELFEIMTKEALEKQFPDWKFNLTGWSRSNSKKLAQVVSEIVELLHEEPGNVEIWAEPDANEAGLDLLCYRPFVDQRVGIPIYLIQCATGANWRDKVKAPDIKVWTKVISFAATPQKGFAIPFSLPEDEFKRICNKVDGFMIDRYRILAASSASRGWLTTATKDRVIAWIEPRVAELPFLDH